MTRITLRVPDDVYQQIQERARLSRRSINNQIVYDLENVNALEEKVNGNHYVEISGNVESDEWLRNKLRSEFTNRSPGSLSPADRQDT